MALQTVFLKLASRFSNDDELKNILWAEIEKHYTARGRHYHTLVHLENMIAELDSVKKQIANYDVMLFSLFYQM